MADGSQKKITAVAVGEYVLSADEVTGAHTVSMVTKTFEHVGSYETLLVNDIVVTPEHKFKVVRDGNELWLPASDILVGDSLIARDGNIPVTSVAPNQSLSAVYNLTTVPSHTYYADGVLVHNIKADGGGFNPDP
jgi:intein/homing endonuclease